MAVKLIDLPIEEARRVKWERGMAKHRTNGEQEFQGNPLEELYEELIDALNYIDESVRRGRLDAEPLEKYITSLRVFSMIVRRLAGGRHGS